MNFQYVGKTIGDSGLYLVALMLTSLAAFISVPIYTRLFDPHEYGYLALAIATTSILNVFASGAVTSSVIRFSSRFDRDEQESGFYGAAFLVNAVLTVFVALVSFVILLSIRSDMDDTLFKMLFVVPFVLVGSSFFNVFLAIFRARQQSVHYASLVVVNRYLSLFIGLFIAVVLRQGIFGVLLGILLTYVLIDLAVSSTVARTLLFSSILHGSLRYARKIVEYGTPLILSLSAHWVLSTSDRYMLQIFKNSAEVGIYSISYDLSFKCISLFTIPFITALTPAIINIWEKDRGQAEHNLQRLSLIFFIVGLPILGGFNVLARHIMEFFTTPEYFSGQSVFPFVSIGTFFLGLYSIAYTGLIVYEKSRLIAWIVILSAVINAGLNLVLIPTYGFFGAGISTLIAYVTAFLVACKLSSKYLKWYPGIDIFLKILASAAIMCVVVFVSSIVLIRSSIINLMIEILIGALTYTLLLRLFKVFKTEDVKILLRELRSRT